MKREIQDLSKDFIYTKKIKLLIERYQIDLSKLKIVILENIDIPFVSDVIKNRKFDILVNNLQVSPLELLPDNRLIVMI